MCSKDKRMCTETVYNNGWYEDDDDDDCLDDLIPDILECPVESLDEDSLAEDWESKLGPIPSEVFPEMLPPGGISNVGGVGGVPDHLAERGVSGPSVKAGEAKVQLQQPQKLSQGKKLYLIPKPFQELSPDSVLEHRTSTSTSSREPVTFTFDKAAPQRTRTKPSRSRSTTNPWLNSLQQLPIPKTIIGKHDANGVKKCSHCEITKTPQWREGPMGPKTLCNACGVRYRSGRLFPEYRPAASPTFIPALHSNCHRKVVELRKKAADIDYYKP